MDTETAEGQLFFGDRFPPLLLFSDQLRFVGALPLARGCERRLIPGLLSSSPIPFDRARLTGCPRRKPSAAAQREQR